MFAIIRRKHIIAALAVLLILAAVPAVIRRAQGAAVPASAQPSGNWGLSFQTEGEPPVGNATAEDLRQYDAWYVGDTSQKTIYLTFDAGYEAGYMPSILDTLARHQVPAAFFVVGHYLEENPDLVRRMAEEGHIVANHTYHHYDMSQIADRAVFEEELRSVEELYASITGQQMQRFYRPPRGIYSEENLKMAQELGYRTVFWSLAYVDWLQDDQPTAQEAFDKLLPRIHPGAVVLLHSTSLTNSEILDELLTRWEEMGYSFAPLTDLV